MLLVRYFPKHKGLLHIYSATFLCDDTRTITEMCAYICGRPQTVDKRDTCAHGSRTRAAKEFHFWFAQRCAQRRAAKRGEQWASNWKACKGIWNGLEEEGRRMRWSGVKINKPQWVRRVHPWRAWAAKKSHFISIHTARESAIIGKRRGFNKKFESGLRDFADDRPGLEDKRESGWKRVPPTAASRFEREGRLPSRAEYRVILLVSRTKSLHDKCIPTRLRSTPERLSVYDYGDCEVDKVHIVTRGSNESFSFSLSSFDRRMFLRNLIQRTQKMLTRGVKSHHSLLKFITLSIERGCYINRISSPFVYFFFHI